MKGHKGLEIYVELTDDEAKVAAAVALYKIYSKTHVFFYAEIFSAT